MPEPRRLLAVPNFSEGRNATTIDALAAAVQSGASPSGRAPRLLDVHTDLDHHRSVLTIAGEPAQLVDALLAAARVARDRIDLSIEHTDPEGRGQHPHVGALDVAPFVYVAPAARGEACAAALAFADVLASTLDIPAFLYGELTQDSEHHARTRAELRRGGLQRMAERLADPADALAPDFGPSRPHPTAGATLVAARPPLVAFNLQLAPPATLQDARTVAARIREGGDSGLPGLRAIGIALDGGSVAQVSMNVERPFELPLADVVERVRALAPVASAELVGLAPAAAFEGFPENLEIPGFDPQRHLIENALDA